MATEVKCPNCGHQFELNESLKNEVEKELRGKMIDWQKKKEEEFDKQKNVLVNDAIKKAAPDHWSGFYLQLCPLLYWYYRRL